MDFFGVFVALVLSLEQSSCRDYVFRWMNLSNLDKKRALSM
jgi:hypothetical protein